LCGHKSSFGRRLLPCLNVLFSGACVVFSGCTTQCIGLECVDQSAQTSILVFTQATDTLRQRTQENSTLTIVGSQSQGSNWSVLLDVNEITHTPSNTTLIDSITSTNIIVGTSNGEVYRIPWKIGEATPEDIVWTAPSNTTKISTVDDWWIASMPNQGTETLDSTGQLHLYNPSTENSINIVGTEYLQRWPAYFWTCGDLDGDGQSDWIAADLDAENTGQVWLGLSSIWLTFTETQTPDALPRLTGSLNSEAFGHSVLCDTDWTGDDNIDLIISSPFANVNGITAAGRIQLFQNNESSFDSIASITGSRKHEWLGYRLASGDIDNDGQLELANTSFETENTTVQLWSWNNRWTERYTIRSSKQDTFFGYDIEIADINGDGLADLLIGEPYYSSTKPEVGLLTIFKGTTNLLEWNTEFYTIEGTNSYAHLGYYIDTHDFNQDEILDILLPVIDID
jgi:hypothetical protein